MSRRNINLLKILQENNERLRSIPSVPQTKFDILRLVNFRNKLRKSRERLSGRV